MNISTRVIAPLLVVTLLTAACGGSGEETPEASQPSEAAAPDGSADIDVVNIAFKPATMKVLTGTKVTWTSMDEGVKHTVTSGKPGKRDIAGVQKGSEGKPDGVFDGELPDADATYSFTFDKAGTFQYFCEVHPSMVAEIVVQ